VIKWCHPQPQKAIRELRLKIVEGADAQSQALVITALTELYQELRTQLLTVAQTTP
jgi:hypothetical protein